ncbi:MAG: hypothetical protein RIR33_2775 [Pseudomonadota bacterium]|jgi:hypothetical protein
MSVLKLRRDMVVADHAPAAEKAGETDRPFPLRQIEPEPESIIEGTIASAPNDETHEAEAHGRTLFEHIKFWVNASVITALLAAYPAAVVASSDIGDRDFDRLVNRADWAVPLVGAAAMLMEDHFNQLGWATDSEAWEPMARLTGKPAYQTALAGALGDVLRLADQHAVSAGREDVDLSAAARLVSDDATGIQLRAARDALVNYDRRLRRRDAATDLTAAQTAEQLALISAWAAMSQSGIVTSASTIGGSPMDEEATRAVYAAKGRATVSWLILATLNWPDRPDVAKARDDALKAWRAVAEFHPLIVFNGDADGSLFGNHPASMSFLIGQAETATRALRNLVETPAVAQTVAAPGAAP